MPRARCHWALLVRTGAALETELPEAHAIARERRGEFLAGGLAPDALRLFAGRDKPSTHFYDDQRPETWGHVVEALCAAQPAVADPRRLERPAVAWMLGYLTHLLTDVAYWRHGITALPPFPAHAGVHHGAWLLADQLPLPASERALDVEAIRFDLAPGWIDEAAVRRMFDRVSNGILGPDGMWPVELGYFRHHPEARGRADAELLAERVPLWERHVTEARAALPPAAWDRFAADAVASSVQAIQRYLAGPGPGGGGAPPQRAGPLPARRLGPPRSAPRG